MTTFYRIIRYVALLTALVSATSCLNEDLPKDRDGELIEFTFRPALYGGVDSKAIGDACSVDQLRVNVYQSDSQGLSQKESQTLAWSQVQKEGISLRLNGDKAYKIIFWAEDKDNTAYRIGADGTVSADYSRYLNAGFSSMEELDAFYATQDITPGQSETDRKVVLKRPFAQLNFVDTTRPEAGTHTAIVTYHSIPVSFNPFTGAVATTDAANDSDDLKFTFTDFPDEVLYANGKEYHYVSCNYIFASSQGTSKVTCTVEFSKDGKALSSHEFKGSDALTVQQSKKLNMIDYLVPEPEKWSHWNGKYPSVSTLTADPDNSDCYIIDDAEDIAWLSNADNAESLGKGKTFRLETGIDMGHKPSQKSMKLPEGSTFDGNGHTIKGIKMMTGLFGDVAKNLTVRNLTIDDAIVYGTTNSHKGIIANTLSGTSTLKDVTVVNSSVSTMKGAVGGMVGYISRKSASDRSEAMTVVFDGCKIIDTDIESEGKEGYFVGLFRGYDNGETLQFKDNCSVEYSANRPSLESYIIEGNEAVWTAGNDFTRYNAWLGSEECYRGKVYFEGTRFIAKWDGATRITPLLADPVYDDSAEYKVKAGTRYYMIYSAFDLAGARKASSTPMALYFKESVDMNGQGKDGKFYVPKEFANRKCESTDDNYFKPFSYIRNIDGQNNTIYNLALYSKAVTDSSYVSAFIQSVQKDSVTVHKNLVFRNCNSVAPPVQRKGSQAGQDLSHGAIFIYNTGTTFTGTPTYTMDNIHVYDSQVFTLQQSGIIAGIISRGNVSNCTVNNCYIENYKCEVTHELFEKNVTIAGNDIRIYAYFYSYGEIGGLSGMVRGQSTLTNCHVRNTTIHAYGEDDKEADMSADGTLGKLAIASAKGLGFFLVPGRHVSTLIGDIRTYYGETITISGCTVDSATKCTADHDKHNNSFPYLGQAYYIQFGDTKGTVNINGQTLTLADGNKNTDR